MIRSSLINLRDNETEHINVIHWGPVFGLPEMHETLSSEMFPPGGSR